MAKKKGIDETEEKPVQAKPVGSKASDTLPANAPDPIAEEVKQDGASDLEVMRDILKKRREKQDRYNAAQDIAFARESQMPFEQKYKALSELGFDAKKIDFILRQKEDVDQHGEIVTRPGFKRNTRIKVANAVKVAEKIVELLEKEQQQGMGHQEKQDFQKENKSETKIAMG